MKYKIYAGLSGSFGGATYQYTEDYDTGDEAEVAAYERALEIYERYAGLHGLESFGECILEASEHFLRSKYDSEEDYQEAIEEEANEIYNEIREGWISYWVEKVKSDESEDI